MFTKLRPLYEKLSIPFGKASRSLGLTPNFWTFFSLITATLAGIVIAMGHFWWGLVLIIVMNLADMLDGATARAGGTSNNFGTVLDHVCDRYAEFMVIAGIMVGRWGTRLRHSLRKA